MLLKSISFKDIPLLPTLTQDYLFNSHKVKNYINHEPKIEEIQHIITQKENTYPTERRHILKKIIAEQYSKLKIKNELKKNIELLEDTNTFTVTTGHQLCLFLGPAYMVYKIISTIKCCEILKEKYPNKNFIPVFFMASEDHDIKEIFDFNILGRTFEMPAELNEYKKDVGALELEKIRNYVEDVLNFLNQNNKDLKIINIFKAGYLEHKTLKEATLYILNEMFGKYGLICLEPNNKDLKSIFKDIMLNDISKHTNEYFINQTTEKLSKDYKTPVSPRKINLFYLSKDERIRIDEKKDYEKEIETNPERFSPNVCLRPLYQESILPNIVTIGGGSEIAYWLQLKSSFEANGVTFPMLMVRDSATFIDEKTSGILDKMGLEIEDLIKEKDELLKKLALENKELKNISIETKKEAINNIFDELKSQISKIEITLLASIEGEQKKVMSGIENIYGKIIRSIKQKDENTLKRINTINNAIFPDGILQERKENFCLYVGNDYDIFLENLKKWFDCFKFEMKMINEK